MRSRRFLYKFAYFRFFVRRIASNMNKTACPSQTQGVSPWHGKTPQLFTIRALFRSSTGTKISSCEANDTASNEKKSEQQSRLHLRGTYRKTGKSAEGKSTLLQVQRHPSKFKICEHEGYN